MIRVSATDAGSTGCPQALALKVRPSPHGRPRTGSPLQTFALGPLMAALDRVEFGGQDEDAVVEELRRTRGTFGSRSAPAHDGLVSWSVEAFRNYRAAWHAQQAAAAVPCRRPVRSEWKVVHRRDAPDHRGVRRYEQTCWGRRYQSDDGSVREIWLLGHTVPKERPPVVRAAAANVAAFGGSGTPDRVRVIVFGAASPVAEPVLEWTADEIRRRARDEVAPRLIEVVDDTARRTGGDCARCPQTSDCSALPAGALLPHAPATGGPRRSLSVTDLRYHHDCPARYHLLMQLHIRDAGPAESLPILVGRAVDAALRDRHGAGSPTRRCSPEQPMDAAVAALPEDGRSPAARMLARHSAFCPYPDVDEDDGAARDLVVVHDERLGVVFVAAPDLLYRRSGGWVWRETKTSSRGLRRDLPLLRQFPQLALAVLMLAAGALGGEVTRSRVELEHLRPDGCALEEWNPDDPDVVAEARRIIGDLVVPLLADAAFEATPGRACGSCEVRRWCAPGARHVLRAEGPTA